ncbi:hypothetical protein DPMN_172658 [Dreissena polymorpha]|uniref:Uncharacterized protein n=1 Tax=Dreissena polymorpha TaxID=45954 RepID=A0A9D4E211_DREPO|nr:hypothetical protein DPMN_172658 [Dreissena polymorpha]
MHLAPFSKNEAYIPQIISFRTPGNIMRSLKEVMAPSSVPNMLSKPSVSSIRKNNTDQSCATGNWLMASVNTMKARPVPDTD